MVLGAVLGSAVLTTCIGRCRPGGVPVGSAVGVVLMLGAATAGVVAWYLAWPPLGVVPVALTLGASAASAVTLVVPFRPALVDDAAPSAPA